MIETQKIRIPLAGKATTTNKQNKLTRTKKNKAQQKIRYCVGGKQQKNKHIKHHKI